MKIKIDGIDRTDFSENLEELEVSFVLNESDRTAAYSVSGTVILIGEAYDQISPLFYDVKKTLKVKIEIPNVTTLSMVLTGRGIRDCGDCKAEIMIETDSLDTAKYEILARSIITDGTYGEDMGAMGYTARVPYCNEPNFISYVILVFYLMIKGIVDFITFIVSIFDDDTSIEDVGNWALGCPRYHIAVNINRTIEYWSTKAGLSWSSSILQDDFKDLHLLEAYGTEGLLRKKGLKKWDDSYIINYTPPQLLDILSVPFNADYRVINGVLRFERVDWFPKNAARIFGEIWEDYCVELDEDQLRTYLQFRWESDFLDEASHKIQSRYNGITDFNPMEVKTLKGGKQITPSLGMSRFNADGKGDYLVRKLRKSPFVGASITDDLILSRGSTNTMRLLDLEPGGAYRYAKHFGISGGDSMYQARLRWKSGYGTSGLYDEYYSIEDPRSYLRYTVEEIKIKPTDVCNAIQKIQDNSMNVYIDTPYGRAIPGQIDYLIDEGLLSFKNCVIWPS